MGRTSTHLKGAVVATWLHDTREDQAKVRTVAVLLGWTGSVHPHLAKYAQVYHERGISTVQYSPPLLSSLGQGQWKSCARDILCLLQDEALLNGSEDELQVVFHVFSNGGFLPYVQLIRLVETEEFEQIAPLIKGAIVDSAPAYLSVLSSARAFSSPWLKSNIFVRWIMLSLFATLLSFAKLALLLLTRKSMNHYAQFHLLHSSPVQKRIPSLYLYSKDDHITDHKYLEHFVASLKQSGADVQSHVFGPKSGHVAHMYHHREAYLRQLDAFLHRVLAS